MLIKASEQKVFEEGEPVTVLFAEIPLKGKVIKDHGRKVLVKLFARIFIRQKVVFQGGILGLTHFYEAPLKDEYTDTVEVSRNCISKRE